MIKDLLDQFIDLYEQESKTEALRLVLPSPMIAYDDLFSKDRVFFYFVNFVDAAVFKGALEFKATFLVLESLCQEYPSLKFLGDRFLEFIRIEYDLFTFFSNPSSLDEHCSPKLKTFFQWIHKGILSQESPLEDPLKSFPSQIQTLFSKKLVVLKGWERLKQVKSTFIQSLGENLTIYKQPWHCFSYSLKINPKQKNISGWPLIFLEPVEGFDYYSFLQTYCSKKCLIIFPTISHLFQILQFEDIHEIFMREHVYLYVLDIYPHQQFLSQHLLWEQNDSFDLIEMVPNPQIEKFFPALEVALKACLIQSKELLKRDTEQGNGLYALGKKFVFDMESHRYGTNRAVALGIEQGLRQWYDPHKGAIPVGADLGPLTKNYLQKDIQERMTQRKVNKFQPNQKIKLAHIVPQIVDGGHAPSKLLTTICTFTDQKWFNLSVFSTERLAEHLLSYPINTYHSGSSVIRGNLTLNHFKQLGVKTAIDPDSPTYELTVKGALDFLEQQSIDVVIFHGPDELNSLISSSTSVPIRVLFDHGTLPLFPCFDLVILSTEEAYVQNREKFRLQGMESCVLPFSINVRQGWNEKPFSKEELGLPKDSFVLTTISHHLDTRVSEEMLHAIAKILKKCPKAIYAPIGEVTKQEKWKEILDQYGVKDKLFFLGTHSNPSQYARSMELYLNEFPFGSGLALLDAMAAGCPVVSMYEENGPQQARYAATYFGIDYVVKTGRVDDYIELACRLIENPVLYREWSVHALNQYEKRVDTTDYVKKFQIILEQFIEYSLNNEKNKTK
ncbi:glycosyltransferase [Candidatus Protochlamydia sp. W-9]|uniref:glycosyltransferase n=1 Tax=Candidatus Protochlamydia sp. W-9 TaxID=1785087 RepID=UPI00096A4487|nr:glycosyltransferase [Candidatus Protochlamydia sp. W-9]